MGMSGLSFVLFFQMFCVIGNKEVFKQATFLQDSGTQIRVINNSNLEFTHVSLFSMHFEDLQPRDTSVYKVLQFDPLKDDSLIYCMNEDKNLGRYLTIPDKDIERYTYSIDSLINGILYVSSKID